MTRESPVGDVGARTVPTGDAPRNAKPRASVGGFAALIASSKQTTPTTAASFDKVGVLGRNLRATTTASPGHPAGSGSDASPPVRGEYQAPPTCNNHTPENPSIRPHIETVSSAQTQTINKEMQRRAPRAVAADAPSPPAFFGERIKSDASHLLRTVAKIPARPMTQNTNAIVVSVQSGESGARVFIRAGNLDAPAREKLRQHACALLAKYGLHSAHVLLESNISPNVDTEEDHG